MTILFKCPHCGTETDVYEEFAGQTGPCVVCGRPVTVPYPEQQLGYDSGVSGVASPDSRPTVQKRGRVATAIVAIIAVLGICAGVGVFLFVLFALVFPAVTAGRQAAQRSRSSSNLQAIVTALGSYEAEHGCLPPAYVTDENNLPMHSWRVLLLPHLGYDHVYEAYDFSQPWDSDQNMQILTMMPSEYASPADPDAASSYETSYMVVVGPSTAFPGSESAGSLEFMDDLSQIILVAETPTCGVCWMQPKDLMANQMRFIINGREGVEIGSKSPGGAHVGLANGTTEFLPDETPSEYVQGMTTTSGGESMPWVYEP